MSKSDLKLTEPLTLKCGLTLPNRLVKAAMAEHLAGSDMLPNEEHVRAYSTWADGGWGMVLTGNVQVDCRHLGSRGDVSYNETVPYEVQLDAWKRWAKACNRNGTPTVVQINHPGRQSMPGAGTRGLLAKTVSSSATPLRPGEGLLPWVIGNLIFGTPRSMTREEIRELVAGFARMAKLSADAGFAGAEIHAAHGYLLDQFLSSKVNTRTDEYGGSPAKRAKVIVEIIEAMRAAVPAGFCIGIKLNSVDHQSPEELAACIEQLRLITGAGIDFLEVSGGTYENPKMMSAAQAEEEKSKSARTKAREAFFLEFAAAIRHEFPDTPLMVTGGFRSRNGMEAALQAGDCELIGLGRPAALDPYIPRRIIINNEIKDHAATLYTKKINPAPMVNFLGLKSLLTSLSAGAETAWYGARIRELGKQQIMPARI